jgi:hypothetical protein
MSNTGDMNEMENWIEGQLNHTEFIQRVPASEELKARLRSIPVKVGAKVYLVPRRAMWATAAAIALLITVNLLSVSNYRATQQETTTDSDTSYFSYLEQI